MTEETKIFVLILVINGIGVFSYWAFNRFHQKEKAAAGYGLLCVVMLLMPVAGFVCYLFGWLFTKVFFKEPEDIDSLFVRFERHASIEIKADEEKERNLVPLEEAIAVTEKTETRVLVMDIVRRDVSQSLSTIFLALNSDDSEVAHYAASILSDELGNFRNHVEESYMVIMSYEEEMIISDDKERKKIFVTEARAKFDEEEEQKRREGKPARIMERMSYESPIFKKGGRAFRGTDEPGTKQEKLGEEMQMSRELISVLESVLRQKVFTKAEQDSYTERMEFLMQLIDFRDVPEIPELVSTCVNLTAGEKYDEAEVWCKRLRLLYPDNLETYKCALKLAYARGDYADFRKVIDEMKNSKIELDPEMIRAIRFWG